MDLGLEGRTVIVTGGSHGIGLATAELLVGEGANVAICGRTESRLAEAEATLGTDVLLHAADVRDADAMRQLVDRVVERFGGVDGLVNNAGTGRMSGWNDTADDDWRDELDLKFFGLIHPTRAAEPHLRASGVGAIVNMNAALARQPETHMIATSAARAGALNLTKNLARELAPEIRVNAILLGLIDSGPWTRRYEAADTDQTYDEWCADLAADRGVPLGRLGRPDEVAPVVATLLSPKAGYTTGALVEVSGGVSRGI
jgi:NAD(P)-dependent dehydrogenase (short-subunit alcohol dehydrogenase family)